MNAPHNQSRSTRARRAWAQPRFLLGAAALTLAGATWAAFAAPSSATKAPVAMPHTPSGSTKSKPVALSDLPGLVARYGESRRLAATPAKTGSRTTSAIGTGQSGFNLVETDITTNNRVFGKASSDEREPLVSPGGDFIAFVSNGADANGDGIIDSIGKYHVWVMNRDGSNPRQISGLGIDRDRNQRRPSWSPDGNQLVYSDEDANDATASQLWVVQPFDSIPTPEQRTFFPGRKESPAWAPSGLSIAFVTNYDGRNSTAAAARALNSLDIFSISPSGTLGSLLRLTGGSADPIGDTTDDTHPAWALVNQSILFFSSNRDNSGKLAAGRRIWKANSDGSSLAPITNPIRRSNGQNSDEDDYPALSLSTTFADGLNSNAVAVSERLAFQTNSFLDDSDQADGAGGRDLNVWTLPVDTTQYQAQGSSEGRLFISNYGLDGFDNDGVAAINTDTQLPSSEVPFLQFSDASRDPEGVVVRNGFVYVSDRGANAIDRFNERDGTPAFGVGATSGYQFTTSGLVPNPSGMAMSADNRYIYVAGGYIGSGTKATAALYRFNVATGTEAGIAGTAGDAAFTSGETAANGGLVTNGCEGVVIGQGAMSDVVFTSVLLDNKVNAYSRTTGKLLTNTLDTSDTRTFVPPAEGQLNLPTGLSFGPDLNGDGFNDLYVSSSGNDSIKVFYGPNTSTLENSGSNPFTLVGPIDSVTNVRTIRPGTFMKDLLPSENNGDRTGLNAPKGLQVLDRDGDGNSELYVSSFRLAGTTNGAGNQLNRYQIDKATGTALSFPSGATTPLAGNVDAAWVTNLNGPGYFDFNARGRSIVTTPAVPTVADPLETAAKPATIATNILSSPNNFVASQLAAPRTVDRSSDREPSFSRSIGTARLAARLVFASNRVYAPNTTANPVPANQFGGDGESGTHDIWTTSTQDSTPPALVPQAAGNLQYPVVAPQPDAPFFAPRTPEEGLTVGAVAGTNGSLRIAVVLSDTESGIDMTTPGAVTVSIFRASAGRFKGYNFGSVADVDVVNEDLSVQLAVEQRPLPLSINGRTSFPLNVYDDGPVASGGHEQQAGAVSGDGNYYCETSLTPPVADDYYLDVNATDQVGNSFTYDNIWGFSTRAFQKASTLTDLFVSDYTCGQQFQNSLIGTNGDGDDGRFVNMDPVESYYLTNPGGQVVGGPSSSPATFSNVDIWRVLSRGPLPQTVLDSYRPRIAQQIDPNDPTGRFVDRTRNVAVAQNAVIWASPYTGTTFAGPGTLADTTMQARLANFMSNGGRLFISGRDVAWGLTSGGTTPNSFLKSELGADFASEAAVPAPPGVPNNTPQIVAGAGAFAYTSRGDYANLQVPYHSAANDKNHWNDGAYTQDPTRAVFVRIPGTNSYVGSQAAGIQVDLLSPQTPANGQLTTAYTLNGTPVGQRIIQTRNNGIESRAVFFSFGFESVNRRYRKATPGFSTIALDTRRVVADSILQFFKTGSVSGTVINDATNLPIANFLVQVTGNGQTFLARTDVNGNFDLAGLSPGSYRVESYIDNTGKVDPNFNFFGGTPRTGVPVVGGRSTTGANLRPIPKVPGGVVGKARISNGTLITTDDTPAANLQILIRSKNEASIFPGGGQFARLTTTDAGGNYSLSSVPAGAEMEVIFNPTQSDVPAKSNLTLPGNPIKDSTNASYYNYAGDSNFGRRIVPDTKRPETIIVPSGDNFILDDDYVTGDKDTVASQNKPIIVPQGPTLSGSVTVNGTAVAGARVELLDSTGNAVVPARTAQTTTSTTGYSFADLKPATYILRATYRLSDGTSFVRNVTTSVPRGQDVTFNIDFVLATLTGKVVQGNNVAVPNANVVLQNADGSTFVPSRVAKTNASGIYSIPNVPVGGYTYNATTKVFTQTNTAASAAVRYQVSASLGNSLTGSSGIFSVRATDTAVTVPTIQIINQQLMGLVQLQVDMNNPITNLAGATVELLSGNGSTLQTTTTGTDGTYGFKGVTAGSYRVRATYRGDTTTSAAFIATSGAFTVNETLLIRLRTIYGSILDSTRTVNGQYATVSGATVTLSLGGSVVQTVTSGSGGSYQFQPVVAATGYVLKASKGTLSGTSNVPPIARTATPAVGVAIVLKVSTTGTPNPTTFDSGRTYSFSTPYATSPNATTRNSYAFMDSNNATIALRDVFNYDPMGTNAAGSTVRFYTVSRFNPNTLAYEAIPDNGNLSRGEGYLLKVMGVPASGEKLRLATPADNPALQALSVGSAAVTQRFLVNLIYNGSLASNGLNGRNFIGFGFDPSKYGSVVWDTTSTGTTEANTTSVQVQFGSQRLTIKDAVAAGLIYPSITTTDTVTGRSVTSPSVNAFGGYFVQSRKAGVKLLFRLPQANNN